MALPLGRLEGRLDEECGELRVFDWLRMVSPVCCDCCGYCRRDAEEGSTAYVLGATGDCVCCGATCMVAMDDMLIADYSRPKLDPADLEMLYACNEAVRIKHGL